MNMTKELFRNLKFYGMKIGKHPLPLLVCLFFWSIVALIKPSLGYKKKFERLKKYLLGEFGFLMNQVAPVPQKECNGSRIVWFFWWQGVDSMPDICKCCFESLKRNCGDAKINIVDQCSLEKYLVVPQEILDKVKTGVFSITHLSDVVRVMLLSQYGGLWVDATLFFVNPIPQSWFECPFFSIKNRQNSFAYISQNRWSTFIMGTNRQSDFFGLLSELMKEYAVRKMDFIDYMTIDVFMDLLFDIPRYKELISELPVQNEGLHELRLLLNSPFDAEQWNRMKSVNTCFKLTYKMRFYNQVDNVDTYYKRLVNDEKK